MGATYLLRFDDLSPTMDHKTWTRLEAALIELDIRPLLAVIPDNKDPMLKIDEEDDGFWDRVRSWQARGWTIGIHGHQHVYVTHEKGMVGLHPRSEFAGLPQSEQKRKLEAAVGLLRGKGVEPQVWIAPSHSFDAVTLSILRQLGISIVSDGFYLFPHRDVYGSLWIPQQLWRFRRFPFGVWTVCVHHSGWGADRLDSFLRDLTIFRDRISHLDEVLDRYGTRRTSLTDRISSGTLRGAWAAKRTFARP